MLNAKRILTSLILVFAVSTVANASVLTYDLSVEFSGATPPAGAAPWLRAVIDDGGSPGSVTMTLSDKNFQQIKALIQRFRKELLAIADQDESPEGVYQVNFQLFPLAKGAGKEPGT